MPWWSRSKNHFGPDSPAGARMLDDVNTMLSDLTTSMKENRRWQMQQDRLDDQRFEEEMSYDDGYALGYRAAQEKRTAYDEGWQDRARHEQWVWEERAKKEREKQKQRAAYEQAYSGYGGGHGGRHGGGHGGGHAGRHGRRYDGGYDGGHGGRHGASSRVSSERRIEWNESSHSRRKRRH